MVKQYPHILTATIVTDSYRDHDGNWIPGTTVERTISCRAEPNVRASYQITGTDGVKMQFDWTVYMPVGINALPDGTLVNILFDGEPVANGKVRRFSNGQLNTRLWL